MFVPVAKAHLRTFISFFFFLMKTFDTLGAGIAPVVNLTAEPTEVALAAAALCESVRIKIMNLTPSRGPVVVPVRIVEEPELLPIDYLEDVVHHGLATKAEFRVLRKICAILDSAL